MTIECVRDVLRVCFNAQPNPMKIRQILVDQLTFEEYESELTALEYFTVGSEQDYPVQVTLMFKGVPMVYVEAPGERVLLFLTA